MTYISRQTVTAKVSQWAQESAIHFCNLAKSGAEFSNITYPSGLRNVIAYAKGERAEVSLSAAKSLRAAGYMIRDGG